MNTIHRRSHSTFAVRDRNIEESNLYVNSSASLRGSYAQHTHACRVIHRSNCLDHYIYGKWYFRMKVPVVAFTIWFVILWMRNEYEKKRKTRSQMKSANSNESNVEFRCHRKYVAETSYEHWRFSGFDYFFGRLSFTIFLAPCSNTLALYSMLSVVKSQVTIDRSNQFPYIRAQGIQWRPSAHCRRVSSRRSQCATHCQKWIYVR